MPDARGAVHLAQAAVSDLVPEEPRGAGPSWLSASEIERYARLVTRQRRQQFLAGRWLARLTLGRWLGRDPHECQLSAPQQGPPTLEALVSADTAHLSIAHSAGTVVCAVGPHPLGMDVEVPRAGRDLEGIAALLCVDAELRRWQGQAPNTREAAFYDIWTAKEAWLKRTADELSPARACQIRLRRHADADTCDVRLWRGASCVFALAGPRGAPAIWQSTAPSESGGWRVTDLKTADRRHP